MRKKVVFRALLGLLKVGGCLALGLVSLSARGQDWLPSAPFGAYFGAPVALNQDIMVDNTKIGQIQFTYQLFQTDASVIDGNRTGGAGFGGVFQYDTSSTLRLKDGHTLDWIQMVSATLAGPNEWNISATNPNLNMPPFPDTNNGRTSPSYTINRPTMDAGENPNVYFGDTPVRVAAKPFNPPAGYNGNQNWNAELGLVCLDPDTHTVMVLGTIKYGFKVVAPILTNDFPPQIQADGMFTPVAPSAFGAPTQTFMDTFTNAFTGNNLTQNGQPTGLTTTKWTFENGASCCFVMVPEPSQFIGVGLPCLLLLMVYVRKGRRTFRQISNRAGNRSGAPHAALTLVCLALLSLARTGAQAQNHGRYLPNNPNLALNNGQAITNFQWSGPSNPGPREINSPVSLPDGTMIGNIQLTYDIFQGDSKIKNNPVKVGGAGMAGGFFFDAPGVELKPGLEIRWIQIVNQTYLPTAIKNFWGVKDGEWVPDNTNKVTPIYPFQTLPVPPRNLDQPSTGFQDLPLGFPILGNQSAQFELGLACMNYETHTASIIQTVLWGYNLTGPNDQDVIPDNYVTAPMFIEIGAGTQNFFNVLNDFYNNNQKNNESKWTFNQNCQDCFVPEVSPLLQTSVLLMLTLACVLRKHSLRHRV